ncbi:MAG: squalene/phytoene synthase family protein, partial [Brevibacterium sp.]
PAPTAPVPSTPPDPPPRPTPQPRGLRGFDADEHSRYVYGSAEVVGLMCLTVFLMHEDRTPTQRERLEFGARQLGAAFQNINFLRDLADDSIRLGRSYLTAEGRLTETEKAAWVCTIRGQLAHAEDTMGLLPRDARAAVRSAAALFTALIDRIDETPVAELYVKRIRVPNAVKARLAAKALLTTAAEGRTLEHAPREGSQ